MNANRTTAELLREVTRLYVRAQRLKALCGTNTSTVQCHVLTELIRSDGVTQQTLVDRLGLDKGWISRAVDVLVQDGTITKTVNVTDRRSVKLNLTDAGRARAQSLELSLNGHANQILNDIPNDQHELIRQALQLLHGSLDPDHNSCEL